MTLRVVVEHRYRGFGVAVDFAAPAPGVTALFGPSGSGKTSVMNAAAGLLRTQVLRLELNGLALHALPPERRRIGYVFQEGRLFPHLRVQANLLYGAARAVKSDDAVGIGFDDVVGLLGIGLLLRRWPATLSGGERQRVAIGRALLSQPRLLMMDEPLSALDAARKDEILPYLARLRGAFGLPILYASHALDEVVRLADHIVLMEAGQQAASGRLGEIVSRLALKLAKRDDAAGVLDGRIQCHAPERGLSGIACGADIVWVPMVPAAIGTAARLKIPARDVILATGAPRAVSVTNMLACRIAAMMAVEGGRASLVQLELSGGGELLARVTLDAVQRLGLQDGLPVLALIKAVSVEWQG